MSPAPGDVPIYAGGLSEAAFRRAAWHCDGWISDLHTTEQLRGIVAKLARAARRRAARGQALRGARLGARRGEARRLPPPRRARRDAHPDHAVDLLRRADRRSREARRGHPPLRRRSGEAPRLTPRMRRGRTPCDRTGSRHRHEPRDRVGDAGAPHRREAEAAAPKLDVAGGAAARADRRRPRGDRSARGLRVPRSGGHREADGAHRQPGERLGARDRGAGGRAAAGSSSSSGRRSAGSTTRSMTRSTPTRCSRR